MPRNAHHRIHGLAAAAALAFATLSAAGCAQHAAADVRHRTAPFTLTRDTAITAVTRAQRSLPAASLDRLQACYADVESKGNSYARFLIGIVSTGAYDDGANASLSQALGRAIASFNDCELKLQAATPQGSETLGIVQAAPLPVLPTDWIQGFAADVASAWQRDRRQMQALSDAERYDLIRDLGDALTWPDFEQMPAQVPAPQPTT